MTTHERDLQDPVDLCTPDGTGLNPEALGWSRRPLHRANLIGEHGRTSDPEGQLDVELSPRYDKHSKVGDEGDDFGSETRQVFGTFAGTVRTDDGRTISFDGVQGFAEEARQRW